MIGIKGSEPFKKPKGSAPLKHFKKPKGSDPLKQLRALTPSKDIRAYYIAAN
jgi:hypothetical protein